MKHHREKKNAVSDELIYTNRNGMTFHMHLVEKLQDPLVKFICAWYGFAIVKWDDCSIQFDLVTKKSFEEVVRLGVSESGELKRCLDFVNFPTSCTMTLWLPDAMKSLQEYERALVKMFSEASWFRINSGDHYYLENIFHGCMNVEMAKLKLGLMPDVEKPKEPVWDVA